MLVCFDFGLVHRRRIGIQNIKCPIPEPNQSIYFLNYGGPVTPLYVINPAIIDSDNDLSPYT